MKASTTPNPVRTASLILVLLVLAFAGSLLVGAESIPIDRLLSAALGRGEPVDRIILWEIRLPRALLGLAVGASLGLSGAALQGLMRNPLVEPGLVGVSGGASLGAVLALYGGAGITFPLAVPAAGFVGALVTTAILTAIATTGARTAVVVLFGVALSSFTGALTALALNLAPSPFAVMEIVFWLLGSLSDRSLLQLEIAVPIMLAGWVLLLAAGRGFAALTLGEAAAQGLGIDLRRLTAQTIVGTALAVGPAVAVCGSIGFVGLVAPHLVRPAVSSRPGAVLWTSAGAGAILLSFADIAVRLAPTPVQLKIGVATSLIGAPFFLFVLLRRRGAVA